MDKKAIEAAVMASFAGELEALKPGNVSAYANGHNMTANDFLVSAEVSVPLLCQTNACLGLRVLESVKATHEAVACNTNLGMLLLFAPIVMAAESDFDSVDGLRRNLETTLSSLAQSDAEQVYQAIRIANPGGLGKVKNQDVHNNPDCSLISAMVLARQRDSIALQYTNNFNEIFNLGVATIKYFDKRWNSVKWSTVSCYLTYMSSITDSHIERKFGCQIAERIKIKSGVITKKFNSSSDPESGIELLQDFDKELKAKNYNPGTNADLTAASLLVYNLACL
ncbi:MAG: triphosphoribosyl-dephospho-CoA synthase [Proteobacteria bacterium]|nr:triphosphoribosyl-dephospho-CoA synthase [Pseudomonadota bacterium]